jgi:hypothetical protein
MNCNSYLYKMPEKDDSEAISSDGEFNEFKDAEQVPVNDERFIDMEYNRLLAQKYENKDMLNKYLE